MSPEAARASLLRLEPLRLAMVGLRGWQLMEGVGGIPMSEAAMVWGFPVHSNPVIDLNPKSGLAASARRSRRDPAGRQWGPGSRHGQGVSSFRRERHGLSVEPDRRSDRDVPRPLSRRSRPRMPAGAITVKGAAPFERGQFYGVFVTRDVKSPDWQIARAPADLGPADGAWPAD